MVGELFTLGHAKRGIKELFVHTQRLLEVRESFFGLSSQLNPTAKAQILNRSAVVFQSSVDVLFGFVCSANHEPEVTAVIQRL